MALGFVHHRGVVAEGKLGPDDRTGRGAEDQVGVGKPYSGLGEAGDDTGLPGDPDGSAAAQYKRSSRQSVTSAYFSEVCRRPF
jgi:hypothetical protein